MHLSAIIFNLFKNISSDTKKKKIDYYKVYKLKKVSIKYNDFELAKIV